MRFAQGRDSEPGSPAAERIEHAPVEALAPREPRARLSPRPLAAGCGGGNKSSTGGGGGTTTTSSSTSGADATVAAQVPSKYKSKTLKVATDATYAPNEFVGSDGKTVEGMDPDLAKALAKVMGIKVKVVNATFDTIIPGSPPASTTSACPPSPTPRSAQKVVDFVTYFSAGTSFYVKASGGPTINSLADLCGHSVGVERGTTQADDATAQSAKCKAAGKPGVKVTVYTDQNAANLAISSGRPRSEWPTRPSPPTSSSSRTASSS